MSQPADFGVPAGPPATPTQMALRINATMAALLSLNAGPEAPPYAVKGTLWLDTSETPHPVKIRGNEGWAELGTLDPEENVFAFNLVLALGIGDIEGLAAALDGKVPTARTVTGGGLASGGGNLGSNITITVPAASQGEAEAGVDNGKAMTALRTAQAIAALSALANGAVTTPKLADAAVTVEKMATGAAVQGGANAASGSGQVFLDRSGDNLRFRRIVVQKTTTGSGTTVSDVGIAIASSGNDITITLSVTKTTGGGGGG